MILLGGYLKEYKNLYLFKFKINEAKLILCCPRF